nr:YjbH domain-containing protein [Pacificibacter marinus]
MALELKFPVSTYGTPGLIDIPSGEAFPDGQITLTGALFSTTQKHTLSFQISPRIFGSFRYSILNDFKPVGGDLYDRSFDLGYLIIKEGNLRPSIVVGLRDFGGTGVFGSEYIAATKHFANDRIALTGGIGWGRLGSYGGFSNPLSVLSGSFETRGSGPNNISEVGQLEVDQWFRGDAAFFGGFAWQVNESITFKAEYSSDAYVSESINMGFKHKTPFNASLSYGFKNGAQLSVYTLHGSEVGVMGTIPITPQNPRFPSGIEEAPAALTPRQSQAALSWDEGSVRQKDSALFVALDDQGIALEGITIEGSTATVRIGNERFPAHAQALGRTARILANNLPDNITTFKVESITNGITTSRTTLGREGLEAFEYDLENSWKSFAGTSFEDAARSEAEAIAGVYPKFDWRLTPYLDPALFDPDNPVRADVGLQFAASFEPTRGLILSGAVRQPLTGNLDTSTRASNSVLPHVRSDVTEYAKQSDIQIKNLTAEYFFRPGKNLYGRITAGYLETMYGGVSGEVLWKPVNGNLAFGAELNYAIQRDFDQLFGLQDYDIVTGHASAYYDFGGGYLGQLDVGRYLAGDYGATVSLDREFDNGFRVGAFFTLTDVPFDEFGEGSFDKGIRFSIPVDWLTGSANQGGYGTTIRPVQRDGGARLDVRNRLYGIVRGSHTTELEDRWGKFWR